MKGLMYIAGSFHTVNRSTCGQGQGWIDNDPHFWFAPPTWGICRNDLRRKADPGDYVFFVLPKNAKHPQMIFGYMRIQEKISHLEAYYRPELIDKRMGNKNPNGNIIVDSRGHYNRYDGGVHKDIFHKIRNEYVIGDPQFSAFLTPNEIRSLAPSFLRVLSRTLAKEGSCPYDLISRYGTILSGQQVTDLITWLSS